MEAVGCESEGQMTLLRLGTCDLGQWAQLSRVPWARRVPSPDARRRARYAARGTHTRQYTVSVSARDVPRECKI